jgi:aminopeptidase N
MRITSHLLLACICTLSSILSLAQFSREPKDTTWKTIYRATETKYFDLVHTKLDVVFNFPKAQLIAKEWLTVQPVCYSTDSITLDAKGMDIRSVAIMEKTILKKLPFQYNQRQLTIRLPRTFNRSEKLTLYFEYISKPNEWKEEGSAAITAAKGLYFIDPTDSDPNKPTQVWTQGETESNSVWMITIDKPNQKSTQEINMTVPDNMVTLSNGLLTSQKKNPNGTRTDAWKMTMPHAPYLFFMGAGEFSVVKDNYKGKEVSYYVEKNYQPFARGIFGNTPEMLSFFSSKLGVEYPWPKYAQMVGRDFVSGAMENTTATLHQESAYQNGRELIDGNEWEETIAHELFHHWFGDLVTAESWSNLTVNESFANYSEYLWDEYKYGKDRADAHHFDDMQGYLMSGSDKKDLVRFHYASREDMFDAVSYNKGGRILHMLRNLVGDDAFFRSMNKYLTTNAYQAAEATQLRLAFESVTGMDLNWFFNQWYYGNGHPKLKIQYGFDSIKNQYAVFVEQTQKSGKLFRLPIAMDVYYNGKATRMPIVIEHAMDTFFISSTNRPEWISVDADRILLAERNDFKSDDQYRAQWKYGKHYADRKEALDYFAKQGLPELKEGLNDPFHRLRILTIQKLGASSYKDEPTIIGAIERIAQKDASRKVQAAAFQFLAKTGKPDYESIFEKMVYDSSYSVAGACLKGLSNLNQEKAYALAKKLSSDARGSLGDESMKIMFTNGKPEDALLIINAFSNAPLSQEKIGMTDKLAVFLSKINDLSIVKQGVDAIMNFRNQIPESFREFVDPGIRKSLKKMANTHGAEIEKYIESQFK